MNRVITKAKGLKGELRIPGDKSVSHRAVMCNAIASGDAVIRNFLSGEDCVATINVFRSLNVNIEVSKEQIIVHGAGMRGLKGADKILYTANSGTTTRLLAGLLAPQSFDSILDGDESLRKRPMMRVVRPLELMGGRFSLTCGNYVPLTIKGSNLTGIDYSMDVASAQVKSALIFAGLYANGVTTIREKSISRNHTEIMLANMGADISVSDGVVHVAPADKLYAIDVDVPGDISSAAFFMVAGLIVDNSEIIIRNVGINPTRSGIINVLKRMGGDITLQNVRREGEPVADIVVRSSQLHGTDISGDEIPTLIDEIPVIAVAAAVSDGITTVSDAKELKVKESDRIVTIAEMIRAVGGHVETKDDGFVIEGVERLEGGVVNSYKDHRIAMSAAVAGLIANGETYITDAECVDISFPDFYDILERLRQ